MKKVISLDESLAGEVKLIRDDYALGPIASLDTEEGWRARIAWWNTISANSPCMNEAIGFDDKETMNEIKAKLKANNR